MKILFEREKENYNGKILTGFELNQNYFYFVKVLSPYPTNKFWKVLDLNLFLPQKVINCIESFENKNKNDYYCFIEPQDIIKIYSVTGETE